VVAGCVVIFWGRVWLSDPARDRSDTPLVPSRSLFGGRMQNICFPSMGVLGLGVSGAKIRVWLVGVG
jgi:hypothetical protein